MYIKSELEWPHTSYEAWSQLGRETSQLGSSREPKAAAVTTAQVGQSAAQLLRIVASTESLLEIPFLL